MNWLTRLTAPTRLAGLKKFNILKTEGFEEPRQQTSFHSSTVLVRLMNRDLHTCFFFSEVR